MRAFLLHPTVSPARRCSRSPLGSRPLRSTPPQWPSRPGSQRSRTPKQRPPHRLLRCPPQRRPRAPRRQLRRRRSQWPAFLRPLAKRPSRRPMGARPARQPGWCGPQRLRAPRSSAKWQRPSGEHRSDQRQDRSTTTHMHLNCDRRQTNASNMHGRPFCSSSGRAVARCMGRCCSRWPVAVSISGVSSSGCDTTGHTDVGGPWKRLGRTPNARFGFSFQSQSMGTERNGRNDGREHLKFNSATAMAGEGGAGRRQRPQRFWAACG